MSLEFLGALCFGIVIGWFVYFTNRYRKGDVQFADITTLIGIIGGGAVTALFGDAKAGVLFPAYCIGLAVGFFTYFFTLIVLVKASDGAFTMAWFLDGRRKKLDPAVWETSDTRPTTAPVAVQVGLTQRVAALEQAHVAAAHTALPRPAAAPMLPAGPAQAPTDEAKKLVEANATAVAAALHDLMERLGNTTDPALRNALQQAHDQLTDVYVDLLAKKLKAINDSPEVQTALAHLRVATTALTAEAAKMKQAADAIATAAKIIGTIADIVKFLAPFIL